MAARASRRYAGLRSAGEDLEQQEEQKLESPFGSPIKTSLLRRSEDGGRSPLRSPFRPSPSVTTGHARKGLSAQTLIIIALGPVFYLLGRWTSSRSLPHPSAAEGREPQNYVDAFRRDLVDMDQQLQSLIKDGAGALEASKSQWCKQVMAQYDPMPSLPRFPTLASRRPPMHYPAPILALHPHPLRISQPRA